MTLLIAAPGQSGDYFFCSNQLSHQGDSARVLLGGLSRAVACTSDPLGYIYVLDAGANEVIKMSSDGIISARMGGYGWSQDAMDRPRDLIAPNGLDVYIADYGNHRVLRLDRKLSFLSAMPGDPGEGAAGSTQITFRYPKSVALSRFGDLLITDGENARIIKVNSSNEVERSFGGMDAGEGRLTRPSRVRVSAQDKVYVQDGNRIVVFDLFGNYLESLGSGLFSSLKTFTLAGDTLYAFDSCSVFRSIAGGSLIQGGSLPAELCPTVVDVTVAGGTVYILTAHELQKPAAVEFIRDRTPE